MQSPNDFLYACYFQSLPIFLLVFAPCVVIPDPELVMSTNGHWVTRWTNLLQTARQDHSAVFLGR